MRRTILSDPRRLWRVGLRAMSWHAHYLAGRTPRPLACGVYVTNRCNLKCRMCSIWRSKPQRTLDFDFLERLIDDLAAQGCAYLSFSGGEPLLVDHLEDAIARAKAGRIPFVHVVTNGLLLTYERARSLSRAGLDEVSVSIDGLADRHDRIRAMDGAFDQAWTNALEAKRSAPETAVGINTVISPENLREVETLVEMTQREGLLLKVQALNEHPVFENGSEADLHPTAPSEGIDEVKSTVDLLKRSPHVINSAYYLDCIPLYFEDRLSETLAGDACVFGSHHLEILWDGCAYPCLTGTDWKGGFPVRGDLGALLRSDQYRALVRRLRQCDACKKNLFICYFEPRSTFPAWNAVRYGIFNQPGSKG